MFIFQIIVRRAPRLGRGHKFSRTFPPGRGRFAASLRDLQKQVVQSRLRTFDDVVKKLYPAVVAALGPTSSSSPLEAHGAELRKVLDAHANALAPMGWRCTPASLEAVRAAHPTWMWLQPSAVIVRSLPDSATEEDVLNATRRFTEEAAEACKELAACKVRDDQERIKELMEAYSVQSVAALTQALKVRHLEPLISITTCETAVTASFSRVTCFAVG